MNQENERLMEEYERLASDVSTTAKLNQHNMVKEILMKVIEKLMKVLLKIILQIYMCFP